MKLVVLFVLSGFASAAAVDNCNANNCLRQVRASAFSSRDGSYDCSTYQTTYSTATSTVTVASGVAITPAPTNPASRTVPAYAGACKDDSQFRSACSCRGQPSAVVTVTPTVTATQPATCRRYVLRASGGVFSGNYFVDGLSGLSLTGTDTGPAVSFEFANGRFYGTSDRTKILSAAPNGSIVMLTAPQEGFNDLVCTIDPSTNVVACTAGGTATGFATSAGSSLVQFLEPSKGFSFAPIARCLPER